MCSPLFREGTITTTLRGRGIFIKATICRDGVRREHFGSLQPELSSSCHCGWCVCWPVESPRKEVC